MRNAARYAQVALERELTKLQATPQGGRALAAFRSAAAIGSLVGPDRLTRESTEELLVQAAVNTGLTTKEAQGHVARGLNRGMQSPRAALEDRAAVRPRSIPTPIWGVDRLWRGTVTVTADEEVSAWLRLRGLDPVQVELWNLARAIQPQATLPSWARREATRSWSKSGHRLVVRTFGTCGQTTLRARQVCPTRGGLKELVPAGFSTCGFVMADSLGRQVLSGQVPLWWKPEFVIVEGIPDFLVWASRQSDAREQGPVVLGVVSGAWTPAIAARVPDGAVVTIRTHHDEAGDRYANAVGKSLVGRCRVLRSRGQD